MQPRFDPGVLRIGGKVGELAGIRLHIVQHERLLPVALGRIPHERPALGTQAVAAAGVDPSIVPRELGLGILEQRHEALALSARLRWEASQLGEGGIKIDEFNDTIATHSARPARGGNDKWRTNGFLPEPGFLPHTMLAKQVAVV